MKFFDKLVDRRIAAYQRELIEIHYAEVENGNVQLHRHTGVRPDGDALGPGQRDLAVEDGVRHGPASAG